MSEKMPTTLKIIDKAGKIKGEFEVPAPTSAEIKAKKKKAVLDNLNNFLGEDAIEKVRAMLAAIDAEEIT